MDRRTSLKWMMAAAASPALSRADGIAPAPRTVAGYGTDPDLMKSYRAGELWPLTFSTAQRRTAAALCSTIIPADSHSPSAAQVQVHLFIDEWISAPYPRNLADRKLILEGLAWMDREALRRFRKRFATLAERQRRAICDEICWEERAAPDRARPARFFARYRDLTANGFYTTPEGTKDLGFVGNRPSRSFDGPPLEALRKVGVS